MAASAGSIVGLRERLDRAEATVEVEELRANSAIEAQLRAEEDARWRAEAREVGTGSERLGQVEAEFLTAQAVERAEKLQLEVVRITAELEERKLQALVQEGPTG